MVYGEIYPQLIQVLLSLSSHYWCIFLNLNWDSFAASLDHEKGDGNAVNLKFSTVLTCASVRLCQIYFNVDTFIFPLSWDSHCVKYRYDSIPFEAVACSVVYPNILQDPEWQTAQINAQEVFLSSAWIKASFKFVLVS